MKNYSEMKCSEFYHNLKKLEKCYVNIYFFNLTHELNLTL